MLGGRRIDGSGLVRKKSSGENWDGKTTVATDGRRWIDARMIDDWVEKRDGGGSGQDWTVGGGGGDSNNGGERERERELGFLPQRINFLLMFVLLLFGWNH